jgi:hypothetical protein
MTSVQAMADRSLAARMEIGGAGASGDRIIAGDGGMPGYLANVLASRGSTSGPPYSEQWRER